MKIKKPNIIKLLFALTMLFALLSSAYSAVGLNVVLSSQNPDPVSPGNFVFVNVKISNNGDTSLKNAEIEFIEDDNFKVAQGTKKIQNLGVIPAFSGGTDGGSGFVIAKYKLLVDENTPQGLNVAEFIVKTPTKNYEYEFDVLVQDNNPRIQVNSFNVGVIEAGESQILEIELENINSINLKNVLLNLDLDDVEDKILTIESGSNQKFVPLIKPNEKFKVQFNLVASPEAESKPYLVPLNISFEDNLDNTFSKNLLGSVRVYSEPLLTIKLDSQEKFTTGKGKITLAIANPGTSSIKGTQIEVLPSDDYKVVEGDFQYVGDLNPDDFQTVQLDAAILNSDSATLKIKASYLDSYNNQNEELVDVPLKLFTQDELKSLNLSSSSSGGGIFGYIITLVLLVVAFYIGRRLGYKKGKAKK